MAEGRYVRAPNDTTEDQFRIGGETPEACAFETVEDDANEEESGESFDTPAHTVNNAVDVDVPGRIGRLERAFVDLTQAILDNHREMEKRAAHTQPDGNNGSPWIVPSTTSPMVGNHEPTVSIRWDHIKPFPSNVPAREMWETWHRYLETFEIAATFSNANDPARRTQLLFLAMGESMQAVVRAAGLQPNLVDPGCYAKFVDDISNYLKTMTDSSAEHEAFLSMQQQKGESVVSFHGRLMQKVRSCGYHPDDQNRFVRTQLLKGMLNQEVAKAARTYGHEIATIIQAATRNESNEKEGDENPVNPDIFAVNRIIYPPGSAVSGAGRKRPHHGEEPKHATQQKTQVAQWRRI